MKLIKIFKNEYFYSIIARLFLVLVGIAHSVLVARYLGATLKGEMAYITSVTGIGAIILTLGIHQAYPYYRRQIGLAFIDKYMNAVVALFSVYMVISLIVIAFKCQNTNAIAIAILMPIMAYTRVTGYVYLVEEPIKRNNAVISIGVLEIVYIALLFTFTKGNFLYGISILLLTDTILGLYYTIKIKFRFDLKLVDIYTICELIRYGILPMIALLMSTLNYRVNIIMLKQSNAVTLAQIGVYSIGVTIAEKVWLISDAVKEILLSKLAKGKEANEVAKAMRLCFPVSLLVVVGLILLGEPFIRFIFGAEFEGAYWITVVSVLGTVNMVFYKMIATYNIVTKKQHINVIMLAGSVVVNIIINMLLIPSMGIMGAAIATVVSYVLCAIVFIIYFSKKTGIKVHNILFMNKADISAIKAIIRKS